MLLFPNYSLPGYFIVSDRVFGLVASGTDIRINKDQEENLFFWNFELT
jgi:hypothetical protein